MSKLLHRVLSYLLFLLVVALVVCSALFQGMQNFLLNHVAQFIGGYLTNIAQAVTGGSSKNPHGGDLVAFLMFFIMLIELITRHFNRLYWFQHWAAMHLALSPTNMITFSFGIALSYRNTLAANNPQAAQYPPNYVQLLILIVFTTAMYSLFSASDPPEYSELSIAYRLTSRVMEYSLYICFFPKYPVTWCWQIMAPLGLIVCISRSNQIFRLWQNNQESCRDFHDHVIVKQKLHRFYELASERIEKDLVQIPRARPGSSLTSSLYKGYSTVPDSSPNNEDRLVTLKDEVKKAGMYGYKAWKPFSQYCFFWSDGSGILFFSGIFTLSAMMFVATSQLHKASEVWSMMSIAPIAGIFLFLVSQSMPAFVVFLADINNPNPDWRPWFRQIRTFMRVLVTEGLPLKSLYHKPPWCVDVLLGFEGLELVSYVAVYAVTRIIGLGLLFCVLTLARKMKLGIAVHWVWSKLEPDLAFYSAKITAPDVLRVKSAILQAELALDTRIQPCTAASVHTVDGINPCTQLVNVKALLDDLDKALLGEQNTAGFDTEKLHIANKEERKQAIAAGLYTSTAEKLKDIEFPVNIAARLRPILSLLHRLHLHKPTYEALRVVDMLDAHMNNLWARRCSSLCLNEHEVKLMKVQLQASMLLYHFDEPSITRSLTGVTLYEWLEIRRLVPGIEFCDFIAL